MALSALGSKISSALAGLMRTESVDDEAIGAALKDIGNALMEADVNIRLVMQLRKNVLARISSDSGPAVFDKVRVNRFAQSPEAASARSDCMRSGCSVPSGRTAKRGSPSSPIKTAFYILSIFAPVGCRPSSSKSVSSRSS
jgi:hypothetical protein